MEICPILSEQSPPFVASNDPVPFQKACTLTAGLGSDAGPTALVDSAAIVTRLALSRG